MSLRQVRHAERWLRAQEVLRLRADGWTLAQIGERYGVTLSAVGHAIQRWQAAGVMLWDVREAA